MDIDPLLLPPVWPAVKLEFNNATTDGGGDAAAQPRSAWPNFQALRLNIKRCGDEMDGPAAVAVATVAVVTNPLVPVGGPLDDFASIGLPSPPHDFPGFTPEAALKSASTLATLEQQLRIIAEDIASHSDCGNKDRPIGHRAISGIGSQCSINSANDSNSSQWSVHTSDTSRLQPTTQPAASSRDCDVCGKVSKSRGLLLQRCKVHAGTKACSGGSRGKWSNQITGDQSFNQEKPLITLTGEKPYNCVVGGETCIARRVLAVHVTTHPGENLYSCEACGGLFANKWNVTKHMRIHTGERPYECKICDKSFPVKASLVSHMRTHTGERPYKCEICGRSFPDKRDLVRHMRVHTGQQPYTCGTCDRSFTTKSHLVVHMRTHTGERPHKCEICDRMFIAKAELVLHIRAHTGERPYKCGTCDRSFTSKSTLVNHIRYHTKERPYKCEICAWSFPVKSSLVRHMRTHTGERPYKCGASDRSLLSRHT